MNIVKATRNGHGNSKVAEQLNILGSNNEAKKMAYIKSNNILPEALPELFRSHNIKVAEAYLHKFSVVPAEVVSACVDAGRASLLKGLRVS